MMFNYAKSSPELRRLVCRGCDIQARALLVYLSEEAWQVWQLEAAATLFHACLYLEDRLAYELFPAPYMAIPVVVEDTGGGAWE
jgi:hypothetical protein